MVETEIKLCWRQDRGDPQSVLQGLGYSIIADRILEVDQLFDRTTGELRQGDQILRLRRSGDRATVTYKGPANRERYKSREEIEFDVADSGGFELVLARLGYLPRFRYEKYRTKLRATNHPGIVTVDETPMGVFLELEGPEAWIDATAEHLGFATNEYLTISYASLYRDFRSRHPDAPADMIFLNNSVTSLSQKSP